MKRKTELCKVYDLVGYCIYGSKCDFAHGISEIRERRWHIRGYKKRECINYHQKGYCNFGKRCTFVHKSSSSVRRLPVFVEICK